MKFIVIKTEKTNENGKCRWIDHQNGKQQGSTKQRTKNKKKEKVEKERMNGMKRTKEKNGNEWK